MNNSMINPPINALLEKIGDRYSLVTVVSMRARKIVEGSKPLMNMESTKPVTIATNELMNDLYKYNEE